MRWLGIEPQSLCARQKTCPPFYGSSLKCCTCFVRRRAFTGLQLLLTLCTRYLQIRIHPVLTPSRQLVLKKAGVCSPDDFVNSSGGPGYHLYFTDKVEACEELGLRPTLGSVG